MPSKNLLLLFLLGNIAPYKSTSQHGGGYIYSGFLPETKNIQVRLIGASLNCLKV